MTAENKIINKNRVKTKISTQRRKLLKNWLESNLSDFKNEDVEVLNGGCGQHRKLDRRYMVWGGLKIGETTLRLNLFHVGEEGISESAQLVVLQPGKSSIQGLTREKGSNAFSFAEGCLSGRIDNENDLRQQVAYFLKNRKFNTKDIVVDLSADCNFKEADDKTSKNIHPQPCVINRVFKKLVKNRLVVTDKTGIGDIVEQILALDLDTDTMQDLLSVFLVFLKYYKKETCLKTFEGIIRKHFDINQENKLAQTPCKP